MNKFTIISWLLNGEPLCANCRIDSKNLPKNMIGIFYTGDGPITREFADKFFVIPGKVKIID